MDRRKRVEAIMQSRLFREELERIVDNHGREGTSGILQQISEMVGVPAARVGSLFKQSNCVLPVNDIRGVESMGYGKGEKILRCKLAATFRLLDLYGWTQGLGAQITARLNADEELFLVNPYGLMYHEVTASSLNKVDMQGSVVEYGTTNFGINSRRMYQLLLPTITESHVKSDAMSIEIILLLYLQTICCIQLCMQLDQIFVAPFILVVIQLWLFHHWKQACYHWPRTLLFWAKSFCIRTLVHSANPKKKKN